MISLNSLWISQTPRKVLDSIVPRKWQIILLSDGSLTRHIELLMGTKVVLQRQQEQVYGKLGETKMQFVHFDINPPRAIRQVLLCQERKETLVLANSVWSKAVFNDYFVDDLISIGKILITSEIDVYRYIYKIECVQSNYLEKVFNMNGPFWVRHYAFLHQGNILTIIQEFFSPLLGKAL